MSIDWLSEIVGAGLSVKESMDMKNRTVILTDVDSQITRDTLVENFKKFG